MPTGLSITRNTGGVVLTEAGLGIARAITDRHETLTRFLELFGLDDETIYDDVEGMEHHVSESTLEAFRALQEELERAAGHAQPRP